MCVIFNPAERANNSLARWPNEPVPADANSTGTGCCFTYSIKLFKSLAGTAGLTTINSGAVDTSATGEKSFTPSKPASFTTKGVTATMPLLMNKSVLPSGAERTTSRAAITPDAPGLFSISRVWPSSFCSGSCKARAIRSVVPPAG